MKNDIRDRSVYYKEYYEANKKRIADRQRTSGKEWREANKDKIKEKGKEYYSKNKEAILKRTSTNNKQKYKENPCKELQKQKEWKTNNIEKYLLQSAKARSKKHGIPLNITENDIIVPDKCPYLGITLVPFSDWSSPSLDKIIPDLGYVVGNVQVISKLANTMKSCATLEQLVTFAKNVLKLHKG